jgi:hypothetical protein
MLSLKPLLRTALFCLPVVFLLSSCTEEEPETPDTDVREKFLGAWTVSEEVAGASTGTYPATVTLDSTNTSRIRIANIYNLGNGQSVLATVASNSLDIATQTVSGITIGGSGSFVASSFVLNYTANDGSQTESVKATYSR